jgi:hypothetical protein
MHSSVHRRENHKTSLAKCKRKRLDGTCWLSTPAVCRRDRVLCKKMQAVCCTLLDATPRTTTAISTGGVVEKEGCVELNRAVAAGAVQVPARCNKP